MTSEQEAMEAARMIIDWVELSGEGPPDAWPTTCGAAVIVARALLATDARVAHLEANVRDLSFQHTLDQEGLQSARRAGMEEAARIVETVGKDWDEDGQSQKVYACEYLVQQIRAAKEYRDE